MITSESGECPICGALIEADNAVAVIVVEGGVVTTCSVPYIVLDHDNAELDGLSSELVELWRKATAGGSEEGKRLVLQFVEHYEQAAKK